MIISHTVKVAAITGAICLAIGTLCGIGIGWKLYSPETVVESYKPAIVLKNDVVALERKPGLLPPVEIKQAAKELHGHLARTTTIKLQPKPSADSPKDCKCDEITVDVGLVDQGDGIRTVVHAEGADITGGTDNPIDPYTISRIDKWRLGVVMNVEDTSNLGGSVARNVGPFELGVIVMNQRDDGLTGYVTASIRF